MQSSALSKHATGPVFNERVTLLPLSDDGSGFFKSCSSRSVSSSTRSTSSSSWCRRYRTVLSRSSPTTAKNKLDRLLPIALSPYSMWEGKKLIFSQLHYSSIEDKWRWLTFLKPCPTFEGKSSKIIQEDWFDAQQKGTKISWRKWGLLQHFCFKLPQISKLTSDETLTRGKGGSITVLLTGLESAVWQLKLLFSKQTNPNRRSTKCTVILPPLVFPAWQWKFWPLDGNKERSLVMPNWLLEEGIKMPHSKF
jgi:hypothetical protein